MKTRNKEMSKTLHLLHLSENFYCTSESKSNDVGEEVIPLMFDLSFFYANEPNHLINGLTKNALSVLIKAVHANGPRTTIERRISSTARENGLPMHGHVQKGGTIPSAMGSITK